MEKSAPIKSSCADSLLRVTFAPDFRDLGPYQRLLGEALAARNTRVEYLKGYRRGLPLYRAVRSVPMDILHLHYPVHYFNRYGKRNDLRRLRFPADLRLSTMHTPLVYTIHDLYPLDEQETLLNKLANEYALKRAKALIVHSNAMKRLIESKFGRHAEKCAVIPHGDLSSVYGEPLEKKAARKLLGLGDQKICLTFGILTHNKGVEELIEFWRRESPGATLAIVGSLKSPEYGRGLKGLTGDTPAIITRFDFQTDEQLRLWFSAADCLVINYGRIYTSGVASLARSYGLPVLLPSRHVTIDLQEPHPSVFRFDRGDTDFGEKLQAALQCTPSYAAAAEWRKAIAWDAIAEETRKIYEGVMK